MFTSEIVERQWSKLKNSAEDMWNAGDDVDEMNIGETRTDFAIHGIADC